MRGIISGIGDWAKHPLYSQGTIAEWAAAFVFLSVLCFFWKTVIDRIE